MEGNEGDGQESRAEPAKQGEGAKKKIHKRVNFPLHLKNELLAAIYDTCQGDIKVKLNPRRGGAVFVGPVKADVEEAVRQYHALLQKAEEKDQAISKLYAEEGAVEVCRFAGYAKNVACCALNGRKVISSYSWNMANSSEPYSVPGRLRTYSKPRKDEGTVDIVAPRKEKHKEGEEKAREEEEGEQEEKEKKAAGREQQQHQVIGIIRMACSALNPDFSVSPDQRTLDGYDIVTNRNNLRKIFCWACGNRSRWRINIEKISEKTLSLSRFDLEDSDIAKRNQVIADEFEAACCGYSDESYRALIQCSMAGINFLVQCEVDGALPPTSSSSSDPTSAPEAAQLRNIDSKVHEFEGLQYKLTSEPLDPPFVELKTCHPGRLKRKQDNCEYILDTWFQSYLAGVKKLVFGIKDGKGGIVDPREFSSPESFLDEFKEGGWDPPLDKAAMEYLAKTMCLVSRIKKKMAIEPVGAKFYLLMEPCDKYSIKLYKRLPEVASTARLIEKLSNDEAWQVLTDLLRPGVIPDPRAPLQFLLGADPALFLPLLQQRLSE